MTVLQLFLATRVEEAREGHHGMKLGCTCIQKATGVLPKDAVLGQKVKLTVFSK